MSDQPINTDPVLDSSFMLRATAFVIEHARRKGTLVVELDCDGLPVPAEAVAKTITKTIRLLDSIDKNAHGKRTSEWTLIEANVISDRASFTIEGLPIAFMRQVRAERKAKDCRHSTALESIVALIEEEPDDPADPLLVKLHALATKALKPPTPKAPKTTTAAPTPSPS